MFLFLLTFKSEDDANKFNELYYKYNKLLYYYAINILHNPADAEDAIQITYTIIYKNLSKIQNINEKKTVNYIITILKNAAFNIFNKNKKNQNYIADEKINMQEQLENSISYHDLNYNNFIEVIEKLDDKYRIPLLLMYVHGFTIVEIADIMHLSETNIGTRIYRAKLKIKDLLLEMR